VIAELTTLKMNGKERKKNKSIYDLALKWKISVTVSCWLKRRDRWSTKSSKKNLYFPNWRAGRESIYDHSEKNILRQSYNYSNIGLYHIPASKWYSAERLFYSFFWITLNPITEYFCRHRQALKKQMFSSKETTREFLVCAVAVTWWQSLHDKYAQQEDCQYTGWYLINQAFVL